jgi:hypothetical protein
VPFPILSNGIAYIGGIAFTDDPQQVRLADFHFRPNERFAYEYDFCDLWRHEIRLEQIVPGHLSKLRTGRISSPGRETLLALCTFFKVPSTYFFPELEPPEEGAEHEPINPLPEALRFIGIADPEVQAKIQDLLLTLAKKLR